MTLVHNNSITQHISVYRKCIPPRGYLELNDDEMAHESIQMHLTNGLLEIVDNPKGLSPVQLVMDRLGPAGNLLLRRTYALGDVLLMSALVRDIKEKYPHLTIHLHTSREAEPLLRHNPQIQLYDSVDSFRECIRKHGDFIDMNNRPEVYEDEIRPDVRENRIEIMCRILGIEPVHLCPEYYILESEIEAAGKALAGISRPLLGIAPVSKRKEKDWPLEQWRELVRLWHTLDGDVIIFHNKPIPELSEAGAKSFHYFDVRMAAAIAYRVDLMVTLDTLWTHLAAALSVPQVLLTSCTDGMLLSRGYPDTVCVIPENECYPCWYNFHTGGCVLNHHPECLESIDYEYVFELAKGILECVGAEAA